MLNTALICLSLTIYFESRNQPYLGQIAVAEVVLNRVESPKFPNTVCEVVKQNKQFSFFWDGVSDKPKEKKAWERSLNISKFMLENFYNINVVGKKATHYHSNTVNPYWANRMEKIKTIDKHIFYKSKDKWIRPLPRPANLVD
tara:strand:+ start:45 stop:473 length:429 start_codon:yes stop_codon:yes gene_type:complete